MHICNDCNFHGASKRFSIFVLNFAPFSPYRSNFVCSKKIQNTSIRTKFVFRDYQNCVYLNFVRYVHCFFLQSINWNSWSNHKICVNTNSQCQSQFENEEKNTHTYSVYHSNLTYTVWPEHLLTHTHTNTGVHAYTNTNE